MSQKAMPQPQPMPSASSPASDLQAREKQRVALGSVFAAAFLAALKLTVGAATGSIGILSDGAHSGLDLVAALIMFSSVRVADRPADKSHPFGHGKFEHLSAFLETALLLLTCAWIAVEAIERLIHHNVPAEAPIWAFMVMAVSVCVGVFRSRSLSRAARRYSSHALEANALNFSTDVYSSAVVIVGLGFVAAAGHWQLPFLRMADPIAALIVAAMIVSVSLRLGRRTVAALVDAAPEGAIAVLQETVSKVDGVLSEDQIRVRESGNRMFIDLRLTLESNIPLEHAQAVMDAVDARVRNLFPAADVMIHATPREPASEDLVEQIRAVASRQNYRVHDVTAYEINGRIHVNLDLEVDPSLKLSAAHEQADGLENEIRAGVPRVEQVNVHLEPLLKRVEPANGAPLDIQAIERKLMKIVRHTSGVDDCHSVEAHVVGGGILVELHCTFRADLPIGVVHDVTEQLEFRFRKAFPQISKVSIHAEPKSSERDRRS